MIWLTIGAADHVHQFRDLAALVGLVARRDRVLDAMDAVVAQDFLLDPAQRRPVRARSAAPRRWRCRRSV